MPNLLKLKRGLAATIPTASLAEPLFTTDTYDLYIGNGSGNTRFQKYIASGTSSQFLKGDGSLDSTSYQTALSFSSPLVNTSGTISIPVATSSANGYLSSTDWSTFNSKEPAITAGTSLQYYRGDKTFQTLNTSVVPESGAIYFTEPRVLATVLTGLNLSGGGTIAATDSILTAFGKVQNQISALVGGATYQGVWNASTNSPSLASGVGTKGYYYVVSVAGSTNLDGITDWKVGDWAIFNGTAWDKVDNTDAVSSVNGFTGAVNLGLGDISNVTLSSPTNAQLLRFNGTSSKWENWTPTYISAAITSLNGLTAATQTFAVGTSGTDFVISSSTSTHTFNLPDASATARGLVTTASQTFVGIKTFDDNILGNKIIRFGDSTGADYYVRGNNVATSSTGRRGLFLSDTSTVDWKFYAGGNSTIGAWTEGVNTLVIGTGLSGGGGTSEVILFHSTGRGNMLALDAASNRMYAYLATTFSSSVTANSFVKSGGTSSQFLKADGSIDSNTYLTTSSAASTYLPLSGGTLTGALYGTTASFTSNTGNFNLGSQSDTAVYLHFGTKNASGGYGIGVKMAGTINASANFDILHGLYVDYTENVGAYSGVTKFAIYQPDSGKNNYFGGPTTFNSAVTFSQTVTATAFIPTGSSIPSIGMYKSASNVLDFSVASTNLLSINYNTGLSTFNNGVKATYYRIVNIATAEFGINTENNQGFIGTTTNYGFNIMTNNTARLTFTNAGAATFTGALSGTSATFSGDVGIKATVDPYTSNIATLSLGGTNANFSGAINFQVNGVSKSNWVNRVGYLTADMVSGNGFKVRINANDYFTIESTGAATFSSSVTATNGIFGSDFVANETSKVGISFASGYGQINSWGANTSTYGGLKFQLSVSNGATFTPLTIAPTGNIGIGTSSPNAIVQVNGQDIYLTGNTDNRIRFSNYNFTGNNMGAAIGYIYGVANTQEQGNLAFYTNPNYNSTGSLTERMRITSGGDVCINTTSASYSSANRGTITVGGASTSLYALQVNGVARAYLYCDSTVTYLDNASGTGDVVVLNGTGGVKLTRNATSWASNSDERLKNIHSNIQDAIAKLSTLRTVNFSWKSDSTNTENLGLIAQDVEKVFPQIVSKSKLAKGINSNNNDETEYLEVRYTELVPVLVKAIQELKAELDTLKNSN